VQRDHPDHVGRAPWHGEGARGRSGVAVHRPTFLAAHLTPERSRQLSHHSYHSRTRYQSEEKNRIQQSDDGLTIAGG
jgi:hypothetical protein